MSEFEWKALGEDVSEKIEVQAPKVPGKVQKSWSVGILDIAARAGIIIAVIAFVSEYAGRQREQTERAFQSLNQRRVQSDLAAMAIGYLNRDVFYPLCPFRSFCLIRSRRSFENFNFANESRRRKTIEGIRLVRDNMGIRELEKAKFKSSDMREITISEISLKRTHFIDVNMRNATLFDVDMTCASFQGSDLTGAKIYFKSITGANFLSTNISGLSFPDIDVSEDTGKRDQDLEKRGLRPDTFAGAWAWSDNEPKLPKAYQTYEVCEKPSDINQAVNGRVGKPDNCVAKQKVKISVSKSSCQQLEADVGTFKTFVNWVDRQIDSLKGE